MPGPSDLMTSLGDLAGALRSAERGPAGAAATDLADRIDAELVRLGDPGRTPVVAVSGLTGVGKSTLVNRLAGADVCATGPIRPTTVSVQEVSASVVDAPTPVLTAATLLDLPPGPGDSLAPGADLHLFVTTPSRYADAEGWSLLTGLTDRAIPTWMVLVRVEDGDEVVVEDLRRRIGAAGSEVPLMILPDLVAGGDDVVASLGERLADEARPSPAGEAARVSDLVERAGLVATDHRSSIVAGDGLRAAVDAGYAPAEAAAQDLLRQPDADESADRPWSEVVPRLALVLTHFIGAAADETAGHWVGRPDGAALVDGGGTELWRLGPHTSSLARRRLAEWPDEVEQVVTAHAIPSRWWRRTDPPGDLARIVERLARGGSTPIGRRARRSVDVPVEDLVVAAWELLGEAAGDVVATDKRRFLSRLPDVDAAPADHIEHAAAAVRALIEEETPTGA